MCVWSGQGGGNCREAAKSPSFPRPVTKRLYVPRSIDGYAVVRARCTRTHAIGRRYSSCNLPRWNAIETIPVILAFQRAFNRACRVLYQNGNRANGFEREKEKFAREAGREGGPRLRTRRTPSRKLFAVLSANRVNLHKSRGDNNRA